MRRIAGLIGALGGVALGFGLLSAVVAIFQPVTDPIWIVGNLALGAVLLVIALVASFDRLAERMRSGETRRAGRYGASAAVGIASGFALLVVLAFLSTRYSARFDWSESGVNTLTDQTLGVLSRLDRDVAVRAFLSDLEVTPARELLKRYERASDHFSLQFVDPLRRPDLVEAYELDERLLARGVVRFALGDAALVVEEFSESTFTNALLKLTQGQQRKVYFVSGHNERPIAWEGAGEDAADKEGMSRAAEALRNETYRVDSLVLASVGDVPEDADALVIAGPTRVYQPEEHEVLRAWVARGGPLLVMIDPRARTDLYDDLAGWGVRLGDDVVVDQRNSVFTRPMTPLAASYSDTHPITRDLREVTVYDVARSLELDDAVVERFEVLVLSGDDSWAERDLDGWTKTGRAAYDEGEDVLGPIALAVAGTPRVVAAPPDDGTAPAEPRLVVFGDSDFASDEFFDSFRNRDLFVNAVNWLLGDVEQISVRPPTARASSFELTGDQFRRLRILSLFALPEGIAIVGVIVWWARRRSSEA